MRQVHRRNLRRKTQAQRVKEKILETSTNAFQKLVVVGILFIYQDNKNRKEKQHSLGRSGNTRWSSGGHKCPVDMSESVTF